MPTGGDQTLDMVKRAVFLREKRNALNLWKTRPGYHALRKRAAKKASVEKFTLENLDDYCSYLSTRMKIRVLGFRPIFEALSDKQIPLYSEEKKELTGKDIRDPEVSRLIADLETLWRNDPQQFFLLVGKNVRARREHLRDRWVEETADWILNPRLL